VAAEYARGFKKKKIVVIRRGDKGEIQEEKNKAEEETILHLKISTT
jgi:hypothetical protein